MRKNAKDVASGNAQQKKKANSPERTPFERMTEFARRIVAVPKSELSKKRKRHKD